MLENLWLQFLQEPIIQMWSLTLLVFSWMAALVVTQVYSSSRKGEGMLLELPLLSSLSEN